MDIEAASRQAKEDGSSTRARVTGLEAVLGDPADNGGALAHGTVLDADQREMLPEGGEELLDRFEMKREFVPEALGGRYTGLDSLTLLLRAVARRDFALALSYGAAVFVPAAAIWCDGSPEQQDRAAALLGRGERLAVAFHDLSHGNDFVASGIWARPQPDGGLLLGGHKRVITNAPRAQGFVILARSGEERSGGGHCAVFVERAALAGDALRDLPAVPGAGPRRCPSGGVEFLDCGVPADALLGKLTQGTEIMLRALQVTRPLAPSMAVGCADTAVRAAALVAAGGHGAAVHELSSRYARRMLAAAFLDLLLCDSLLLAATRAVHVLPAESSLSTAAAKYLVPRVLGQAVTDLLPVLGERFQDEEGGVFRKHARDLAELPPGHAGAAAALASILPQLPTLARRSWTRDPAAEPRLFRLDGPVPPLEPALLHAAAPADSLLATLAGIAETVEAAPVRDAHAAALRAVTRTLADEFSRLRLDCAALPERDPAALATPRGYALAERYALLASAAACMGVWLDQWLTGGSGDGFLADPAWLIGTLGRVCLRLGLPVGDDQPARGYAPSVFDEVARRVEQGLGLDLLGAALGGAAAG